MNDRSQTPAPRNPFAAGGIALALGASLLLGAGSQALACEKGQKRGKLMNADPGEMLERLDLNQDGVLTPEDVPDDERGERMLKRLDRLDSDGDGRVTLDELEGAKAKAQERQGRRGGKDRRKGVQERFESKDADGDGRLSWDEFRGDGARFSRLDTDGDGVVLRSELGDGERAERKLKRFDRLDADHDGELTQAEVEASQAQRFETLDADGDGFVVQDELSAKRRQRGGGREI